VNTLTRLSDGRIAGDNTDGPGLVRDLAANHGFDFSDRRVLLLGAGGAAHGVLGELLAAGLGSLTIANRTPEKAVALAQSSRGDVTGCGLADLEGQDFDLIVNATSSGLGGDVPTLPEGVLAAGGWTYDMVYADEPTPFCRWGQGQGAARTLDGLGMLVEQAAESFWLWRGVRPSTAPVIELLRGGA
jgi:shikimate dehydrogenase